MLGRIAKLYYEYNYTHQEIADLLGWNRVRVTRALREAREVGIVHISVDSDEPVFLAEENALRDRYGLDQAWVAPTGGDGLTDLALVGMLGAQAVDHLVADGDQVAVGVSETLAAMATAIPREVAKPNTTFIPLQGTNPGLVTPPTPNNIAAAFADAYGGRSHALAAPVFAGSPSTLELLQRDADIAKAFDTALSSDLALVGVGACEPNGSIILRSLLDAADAAELQRAGAVGDINARFYDIEGRPVSTAKTSLVLGPSLDEFKRIPKRVAAAAGLSKVPALRGALNAKLITSLITDLATAKALLDDR